MLFDLSAFRRLLPEGVRRGTAQNLIARIGPDLGELCHKSVWRLRVEPCIGRSPSPALFSVMR
jgi:hypothetical protein